MTFINENFLKNMFARSILKDLAKKWQEMGKP